MSAYQSYTDAELLLLLSQDSEEAFEVLYLRHWENIYKAAFVLLKDSSASKDVVQDIFIWLWQKRNQLEIQTLPAYLKTAVKFKVANYIRSGNFRESFFETLGKLTITENAPEAAEITEMKELKAIIINAVELLPDKCRTIYKLSRNENLTNQQIADQLGLSVKTVEGQMTIALRRIKGAIGPYLLSLLLLVAGDRF